MTPPDARDDPAETPREIAGARGVSSGGRLKQLHRRQWMLGLVATLAVLGLSRAGLLDALERATFDWRTHWFHSRGGPSPDVVVMGIDDPAVEMLEWPWSREVFAAALDEMRVAGAKTIALDVLFENAWKDADGAADAELARAMREHGGVVLPMRTGSFELAFTGSYRGDALELLANPELRALLEREASDEIVTRVVAAKWEVAADRVGAALPTARTMLRLRERSSLAWSNDVEPPVPVIAGDVTAPLLEIADAAAALGDVSIAPGIGMGADGVCRHVPLWTNVRDGRLWPSFPLAAVGVFLRSPAPVMTPTRGTATTIDSEPERRVRSIVRGVSWPHDEYPYVTTLTWPRGGRSWAGQFRPRGSAFDVPLHEVSVLAALEPLLIRRGATSNMETLSRLLEMAGDMNLGTFTRGADAARRLASGETRLDEWAPVLLEEIRPDAERAAAEAKDYLEFAGEHDLSQLSSQDALAMVRHTEVATKIPQLLDALKETPAALDASRLRLRSIVADKLVFVGWTATGVLSDRVNTSVGPLTPGVYIHAAAASSFLTGFTRLPLPAWADAALVLILGVCGIVAARHASVWLAPVLVVVVIGGWFLAAGVVFWDFGWRIAPVAAPSVGAASSWLAVLLHRLLVEQRLRRRTEERFRAYVSPLVVDELVNNPELDSMEPKRRELSIMFCDVAGFTAIAEKLGAEGTSRFLTGYLGRMTDTLLKHGATIDKYLGDGIMAFWGAPIQDVRHARNACRAAAAMVRAVAEFGLRETPSNADAQDPLRIRIGVAAGDVMVGDFGNPPTRSSYTVLGDACNVAARLERACKVLGTTILASASVRAQAGEGFLWRPLGSFILHGRTSAEAVFELVGVGAPGARSGAPAGFTLARSGGDGRARVDVSTVEAWIETTTRGVEAFTERRWADARREFETLEREHADTMLARVYLSAIAEREAGAAPPEAISLGDA